MFGPIVLASASATWLVNNLLDRLAGVAISALLRSEGLNKEVGLLEDALRRAKLVLGAVPAGAAAGVEIRNEQLVVQITQVERLAADSAKHLDELEYYDFKKKVLLLTFIPMLGIELSFFEIDKPKRERFLSIPRQAKTTPSGE